jgi:hypothetical protein
MNDYKASASLWRPEVEMGAYRGWLFLAQFIFAAIFTIIWANGFPVTARLKGACLYGGCVGLMYQTNTLILYAVSPLPASIAVKWFVSGIGQGLLLGLVAYFVYRPASSGGQPQPK